jgi:hypothetical protein
MVFSAPNLLWNRPNCKEGVGRFRAPLILAFADLADKEMSRAFCFVVRDGNFKFP